MRVGGTICFDDLRTYSSGVDIAKPALRRALTPLDGVKAVAYLSALVAERSTVFIWRIGQRILGKWTPSECWPNSVPLLRKVSRKTIMRNVFSKTFNGSLLKNLRQNRPQLIVIACGHGAPYLLMLDFWERISASQLRISCRP